MSKGSPHVAVCLLSGGLDSCVVAGYAKYVEGLRVHALVVDYGQRHRHELTAAAHVSEYLGLESLHVVRITLPWMDVMSLGGGPAVAKDRTLAEREAGISPEYVPARNTLFCALAAGHAEHVGAGVILVGWHNGDHAGFPDTRPAYTKALNDTLRLGTVAQPVVKNPLGDVSKSALIFRGKAFAAPLGSTWSCYDPQESAGRLVHCGRCDACRNRREAFTDAGAHDPTTYAA